MEARKVVGVHRLHLLLSAAGDAPLVHHMKQSRVCWLLCPLHSTSRGEGRRVRTVLLFDYVYFKVFCKSIMFLQTLSWRRSVVEVWLKLDISQWLENLCEIGNNKSNVRTQLFLLKQNSNGHEKGVQNCSQVVRDWFQPGAGQ